MVPIGRLLHPVYGNRDLAQHKPLDTPHLTFGYRPIDFRAMRETGASWKIVTEETPELPGINPNGGKKP